MYKTSHLNSKKKTYFVVAVDRRPDFINLQMRSLQKFCIGDFELIVLNNSQNRKRTKLIEMKCGQLGARHVRVNFTDGQARSSHSESIFRFGRYSSPNVACSYPYHWFVKRHLQALVGANLVFIDSDMFLVKPVDFSALLYSKSLFFVPQFRGTVSKSYHEVMYPWNALMIVDTTDEKLRLDQIEWSPKIQKGFATDVGGASTEWLETAMREVSTSELLSFGILNICDDSSRMKSRISLNGNWIAILETESGSQDWRITSRGSFDLAERIMKCNPEDIEAVVRRRLVEALEMIEPTQWPAPLWVDLLSAPEVGLNDFVVHYKSGSNYQKWATPEYNSLKTRALTNCFPELK